MNRKKSGKTLTTQSDIQAKHPIVGSVLSGGGEMGKLIRSMDWSKTPIGAVESWPQSLKAAVSIMLTSRYPMFVWWDEALTNLYNDAYIPFLGVKHPAALGQSARDVWAEIWSQVGPRADKVMKQNETTFDESLFLQIERHGYAEETYFTFSYSPVPNDHGGIGGLFCVCNEQTQQIVGDRQLVLLRELAANTADARTVEEACIISIRCLKSNAHDLPFSMIYLFNPDLKTFHFVAASGIEKGHPACPDVVTVDSITTAWPFSDVITNGQLRLIDDVSLVFEALPTGAWDRPPRQAVVMPILRPDKTGQALIIVGLNPYRPFNDDYRRFLELVNAQISSNIANAKAYEEERNRVETLAQIDKAKTLFFSNISHELRTPLTLILGPIEDALHDLNNVSENRTRMDIAYRNALRLLKLVNTLLDFSRIEAGRMQASYCPTDLATFTEELTSMFRSATEKAGLKLIVDCATMPELIYIDKDMWEKIVLNLLSNAFKHTFKGEIEVSLHWLEDHVELVVRDTGVGIPAEQLPRLFERFYRVPNARSRTHEGSGIGLSLVHELVKLHGGKVKVKSVVDQGTTFTVSIPRGKDHLPTDRIEATPTLTATTLGAQPFIQEALHWLPNADVSSTQTTSETQNRMSRKRARVLLADDNADMRDYVSRLLAPYYDVEAVADGAQALLAARRHSPDLVLSDIMMPKMDGLELLKALRNDESFRTIPIIFLSARAGEEAQIEGLHIGADDYITKPFSARELLARVKANLDLAYVRHEELIQKLTQQVQEQTLQLVMANKELESFSYSVSHDLRAPLRAIDSFSQLVLEGYSDKLGEDGKKILQKIRSGIQTMGKLIDAILALSIVNRDALNIEHGIDLSSMAQEIIHRFQSQEPSRKVSFEVQPELMAQGDRILLASVLQNLLDNAWKYTSKHPMAHIQFFRVQKEGGPVYVVKDDGAGFNMAYADKLFGAFQRMHNASEFPGVGVGLATVARIIHRHNGQIWAEGEVEKGATFYFTLPEK